MTSERRNCNVAVIGAGAAGLAAARELRLEGHSVTVFEAQMGPGGTWVYSEEVEGKDLLGRDADRKRVHSSIYRGLRTNLPRHIMGFSCFPFSPASMGPGRSKDSRTFPCAEEVLAYIEAFAERYALNDLVRYGTEVTRVTPVTGDTHSSSKQQWAVEWRQVARRSAGDQQATGGGSDGVSGVSGGVVREVFDAVCVCNGHYFEPHLPPDTIPGSDAFPGLQMHSHNYRDPKRFEGLAVAVVGPSFSGRDIATLVGDVASQVYLCARAWNGARSLGAPRGQRRNVERRGMIARLTADGVAHFAAGPPARIDAIIWCTGYEYSFPFLNLQALGLSTEGQHVSPLFQHVFPPEHGAGLSFIGLTRGVPFPMFELQSKLVARVLSGRASLPPPSEMAAWSKAWADRMGAEGVPPSATHQLDHRQGEHHVALAALCGSDVRVASDWRGARWLRIGLPRRRFSRPSCGCGGRRRRWGGGAQQQLL